MSVNKALAELQKRLDDPNSVLCDGDVDVEVNGNEVNISMRLYFCSKDTIERLTDEFLQKRRGLVSESISP